MAHDFFCVEIGDSTVKVADVRQSGAKFNAESLGMMPTDPLFYQGESEKIIENQATSLSKLLSQLRVRQKNVHFVIPDSRSFNRFVEMPKLNEKELLSAIKYQADQFIPMPIEETNIDIEVVHEDEKTGKLLTLISAAPKRTIEKVEKLAEYAGLVPENIETEISALGKLASHIFTKNDQAGKKAGLLLINVGFNSTTLYCFDQSRGIMSFNHSFNIGTFLFIKEIQVNLNVDQAKATEILKTMGASSNSSYRLDAILSAAIKDFLMEIQKALTTLTGQYAIPISGMYLFNEALAFHELDHLLQKAFGLPTTVFDLYPFFNQSSTVDYFKTQLAQFVSVIGANLT